MPITSQVAAIVKKFQKDNPKTGKAELTQGERSVDEQLKIIIERQDKDYKNIVGLFKKQFKLDEIPAYKDLNSDQLKWWNTEIMKQAGKPNGFAHIGGKAQDVSVKNLGADERTKLRDALKDGGFSVLGEKGDDYTVKIEDAKLFHVYKK